MAGTPKHRIAALALAGGVCAITTPSATAQPQPTVFAGGTVGRDQSAYIGSTLPMSNSQPGGLALRGTLSYSSYDYRSDPLGRVSGKESRAELALLYQMTGSSTYADVGVGARYVHTKLSPSDPGNSRRGDKVEAAVSASVQHQADPWRVAGFASYGFDIRDYYLRGEVTRAVSPAWRLGAEMVAEGDRTYDRQRYGVVVAYDPRPDWEVAFSVGGQAQPHRGGAYAGLAFRRSF